MSVISKIQQIRKYLDEIYEDVLFKSKLSVGVDDRRTVFLLSEIDTMISVLGLNENRAYKESLILIRSSFEKFLYFWLMLDGIRYRWIIHHTILLRTSATVKEARDSTLTKWKTDQKSGHPAYADVKQIQAGKHDDEIIVTYEHAGLFEIGDMSKSNPIPYYNFMLYEYDPEIRTLSDLPTIMEGEKFPDIRKADAKTQKTIYHLFFHFDSLIKNLKINGLINDEQEEMLIVHYNFLSNFVHPGKNSLETWACTNNSLMMQSSIDEKIIHELILLYAIKITHLYIKIFVEHYKKSNPNFNFKKYEPFILELDSMSRDLWFIDNSPSSFDIADSTKRKSIAQSITGVQGTVQVLYYENPLSRLANMR